MSRKTSKRVSFSPDVNEKPTVFLKNGSGIRVGGNRKKIAGLLFTSRFHGTSPAGFLRLIGAKVARVVHFVSRRRRSSRKVSSESLSRSRSLAESVDSQRAEAIEDCIEFLNSSSSLHLQRSNSVSINS